MAALLRHWRRQHTCFWCFVASVSYISGLSALVGGIIAGWLGAALVGLWGAWMFFCGFMIGVDESDDSSGWQ